MKVTIITVCFNSASTIADAINSVASQSYDNIEYVIVDGASTDDTSKIVKQFGSTVDTFVSEPDRGIYDAMNKAVALASGDVIGILNSDDFFESADSVESVVETFEKALDSDIVFGDVVFVAKENTSLIKRFYSSRRFRPWKLRFGWMPPHPATFVRKEVYQKFGKYSLDYKISADYEKFVRWLLVEKLDYARIDRVLVRMRQGGASTSGIKSNFVLNREIVKACRSNGVYTNELFLLAKIPFKLLELVRRPRTNIND
jgi:glycosyltransferase involved in cell wall biosynthesis